MPRLPRQKATEKEKTEKRTKKYSTFYITVNTNRRHKGENLPGHVDKDKFAQGFREVLDDIPSFFVYKDKKGTYADIESITVNSTPEIGTEKGLVHGHAIVKVVHYTNIHLNFPAMKQAFKDSGAVESDNFHFYVKRVPNDFDRVMDYINKTKQNSEEKILK